MLYVRYPQNKEYALIIYTLPFDPRAQELLARANDRHHKPIIGVHSAGFYSYFQTYLSGGFPIVETHPDPTATTDLRLLTPWEELKDFAVGLTKDIETLSDHEHGHIPYVVLLLYYLEKWKEAHGSVPTTYKEKTAFRDMVRAGARVDNAEGGEENFDEAVAAVLKTISAPTLSSNVKEVFDYRPYDEDVRRKGLFQNKLFANYSYQATQTESGLKLKMKYEENYNSNFWVIVDAIKTFYARHNALPLPGSVPDMKAQSTVYVQLQNIYKGKARKDAAEVFRTVGAHPKGSEIDAAEVESFCKNAAFIKLIRGDLARGSTVLREIASK
jgi:amyloid beta precursor protein binding protein 1